ncbi:MAG TPA: FAD binding domain-containing protein [Ktedonobacteraceae bacterium]|jgi:CO/xanthine dehydrogenase FAD-binding subunit
MLQKLVEYHWSEHLDDALLLLGRLDVKTVPLAGGTYLLGLDDDSIQAVVDLRDLDLAYISDDTRGLHLGAMTTLQSLADSALLKEFASGILAESALASASSRLIRNCATLGGTLGAGSASQADLWTALVALDAEVVVRSGSKTQVNLSGGTTERPGLALSGVVYKGKYERRIPCASFALDHRPGELILEVFVPRPPISSGGSFMRVGRSASDLSLLNVATQLEVEDGKYKRVRLIFGGSNMEPLRLQAIERFLEGRTLARSSDTLDRQLLSQAMRAAISEFRPPSDILASSSYRRVAGLNLAYRALEEAANIAIWRGLVSSGRGA